MPLLSTCLHAPPPVLRHHEIGRSTYRLLLAGLSWPATPPPCPSQPLFRYNEIWVLRRRKGKRNEAGATDDDTAPDVDPHDDDDDDDDVDDKDMDCGDWLNGDDADDGGMPFVAAAGDGAVAYDVEGDGGVDERKILPS